MKSGFTLFEILLVVGITLILLTIASLNLSNITPKASVDGATNVLIADLKQQQIKSMSGEMTIAGNVDNYGLYFSNENYILFHGNSYSASATDNFSVHLDDIQISSTFPSSTIVFNRNSGEIIGYQSDRNTITLTQSNTGNSKIITVNKYGIIESIL